MSFTIINQKDTPTPPRPLLLVSIAALDGDTVYLATAANQSSTSVTYGGNTYQCKLADSTIDAIQAMSQAGFDQIPSFTLQIADPDNSIWLTNAQAHGWRGATATLTFVLYDIPTSAYSTDAIQWQFLCENPTRKGANISLAATSKVNAQQIKIPTVNIQYRCPWNFPTTAAQRQDGADNPDSIYYRCGYSPDATGSNACGNYESGTTPFATCDFTRDSCTARGMFTQDSSSRTTGRFGGVTWVAPTTFVGTQYTSGRTYHTNEPGYNQPNPAKYNAVIPWVYGTQWVNAMPLAPAADPNSLRFECIVCLGDVGDTGILKVVCNRVEIPQGGSDALFTWRYINTGKRNGAVNTDAIFDGKGDPYGSICAIEVVIPAELGAPGSIPNVRVLVQGAKIRKAYAIASASASGGEITFTFTGINQDCAGNPPFNVTVVGNSNPAFNGTFQLSNWTYGPPGTITTLGVTATGSGTGGFVFYSNSSTNPVWHLADFLIKTGWELSAFNVQTFINAAAYCDTSINYTNLAGTATSHARWRSSFALESKLPVSQAITMLRRSCNMILHSSMEAGLSVYLEQTLADQQPSAVSGSNYSTAVASVTAGGASANGYLAYLFDESCIDPDSFEITAEPLNSTPNEFTIPFQDEDNQWQADSLKQTDTDALPSSGQRELPQALEVLGPCNFDQAGRLANILLDKAQNGNPRLDHGGTIGFRFTTSMRAVHLATRPGYICGISWQALNLYGQLFRVLSAKPIGKDGRKWEIRGTWHEDSWYEDSPQQIAVPLYSNPFRGNTGGPPIPWKPDAVTTTSADPVLAGASTFALQQVLQNSGDGQPINSITVSGIRPINSLSAISAPLVPVQANTSTSAGSIPAGTYVVQVFAIDSSNQYSQGSTLMNATLSATGEIIVPVTGWDSGTSKYEVFCGTSNFTLQSVAGPTSGTPSSITLTSLPVANSKYGPPDPSFFRFRFRAKPLTQNGSWRTVAAGAMQVTAVNTGAKTITVGTASWTTNEWAGRTLALVSAKDTTASSPVFEDVVVSNTGTVLTMTSTPTAVSVGDWVQVYAKATAATSSTITDSKWVNSVNASGLTANAEKGNLVRIIAGTGAGQTATIASNTTTAITISGTWATTPDSTSIFWIEAPQWTYDYEAAPITVATLDASPVAAGNIPVDNFLGRSVLIEALTEDQNGGFAPEYLAPLRSIYVPGAQGTRNVTSSTTITPSDGTIQYDTSGGNITQALPAASLYPNQDLTFIKTTSDANTLTITGAASGTVVLTQQYQSVTFHSDGVSWTAVSNTTGTKKYTTSWTSQTSVTVTHNLGTTDVLVQVFDGSNVLVDPESVTATSTSVVTLTFGAAFTGRVVVLG
jgi:hypothetical protein